MGSDSRVRGPVCLSFYFKPSIQPCVDRAADISPIYQSFSLVQSYMPAVFVLERMVSEIPRPRLVHALPVRTVDAVAAVFLLSLRQMAPRACCRCSIVKTSVNHNAVNNDMDTKQIDSLLDSLPQARRLARSN